METGVGDAKVAVGACDAVIVVVPGFRSDAVLPLIEATVGSEEVKLHAPRDVEAGATKVREGDADICAVTSGKTPKVGRGP